MKYIVELEDEPCMRENGVNYYICKSAPWYNLGETVINRLTPYTEPDRKVIEDETWELAERIADMSYDDFISCFEGETEEYVYGLPYHEVKAKYDGWKKRKDEFHVGDEVVLGDMKGVVVRLADDGANIVWSDGSTVYMDKDDILKTGKFFEWVEEFMEKMRGEIG